MQARKPTIHCELSVESLSDLMSETSVTDSAYSSFSTGSFSSRVSSATLHYLLTAPDKDSLDDAPSASTHYLIEVHPLGQWLVNAQAPIIQRPERAVRLLNGFIPKVLGVPPGYSKPVYHPMVVNLSPTPSPPLSPQPEQPIASPISSNSPLLGAASATAKPPRTPPRTNRSSKLFEALTEQQYVEPPTKKYELNTFGKSVGVEDGWSIAGLRSIGVAGTSAKKVTNGKSIYVVFYGKDARITFSWKETEGLTKDFTHSCQQKFADKPQAQQALDYAANLGLLTAVDKLGYAPVPHAPPLCSTFTIPRYGKFATSPATSFPTSKYYVVYNGRRVGIFKSWVECHYCVSGYPKGHYEAFDTFEMALKELKRYLMAKTSQA